MDSAILFVNIKKKKDSFYLIARSNFIFSRTPFCCQEHALKAADRLHNVRELKLTDSFTLINHGEKQGRSLNPLPTDVEERRKEVSQRLWESTTDLLQNSELEFSYGPEEESRGLSEYIFAGLWWVFKKFVGYMFKKYAFGSVDDDDDTE